MLTNNSAAPLVLIVEDDDTHADLILRSFGNDPEEYRVVVVFTIAAAKEAMERQPPGLLLTDYKLPDGDGSELVMLVAGSLPVILMTSHGSELVAVEAMKIGAQDYIVKSPETFNNMSRTVKFALMSWDLRMARRQADHATLSAKEDWERTFDAVPDMIAIIDNNHIIARSNRAMAKRCGYSSDQLVGKKCHEVMHGLSEPHPDCPLIRMMQSGEAQSEEVADNKLDGVFDVTISPLSDSEGKITAGVHVFRDITERKRTEESLQESNERFSAAFNNAPIMIAITSFEDGRYLYANQMFLDTTGFKEEELAGKSFIDVGLITDSDYEPLTDKFRKDGKIADLELKLNTRLGKPLLCKYWGETISVAGQKRCLSIFMDISKTRKIEQQLIQAQKLESIGRLAGGVAHDFNNMLSVILGYAELALTDTELTDSLRSRLEEILDAANRSANITGQLLAFSRQQSIELKVMDLNDSIAEMLKMLRRLIGEDIELSWNPGRELWSVKIDSTHLDQIMANLCVNARDAIAGVGKICIQTENITLDEAGEVDYADMPSGDYVMFSVKDNGSGIEIDELEHIFEPFYTTKELGHGTGLGLATVFGIVNQTGGFIKVFSEPGQGTEFRIFLKAEESIAASVAEEDQETVGGSEVILFVEDEPALLKMGTAILSDLGYRVLFAESPEQAKRFDHEYHGRIDLLLTDIIMPGMNGSDLADELLLTSPGMKCLYMSGYSADIIRSRGKIDKNRCFMQKPFSMRSLAIKVREALMSGHQRVSA